MRWCYRTSSLSGVEAKSGSAQRVVSAGYRILLDYDHIQRRITVYRKREPPYSSLQIAHGQVSPAAAPLPCCLRIATTGLVPTRRLTPPNGSPVILRNRQTVLHPHEKKKSGAECAKPSLVHNCPTGDVAPPVVGKLV